MEVNGEFLIGLKKNSLNLLLSTDELYKQTLHVSYENHEIYCYKNLGTFSK